MGTPSERASRSTSGLLLHTARCTGASIVRMGDRTYTLSDFAPIRSSSDFFSFHLA